MPDYPQTHHTKSKQRGAGLFHRALVGELVNNGLLVFAVLLAIVVVSQLIRLLGDAVSGRIAADGVAALLGFMALNYLPILLSISLFVSVLLTISRSYRDSEMVIWFASGVGLTRWVRPVMWYALPVVGVIALLSLVLSPWALGKADEFRRKLESRDDVASAIPGTFRESGSADRVYFIEKVDLGSNRIGNVFVQTRQNGKLGTVVASQGLQETGPDGDRFLVLLNGTRYEGTPGQLDYSIVEFERYSVRIENADSEQAKPWMSKIRFMSTPALIEQNDLTSKAELDWRLGLPLSAAILALLAIPLSYVNPRAGRSFNFVLAIILYMIYNNIISVSNTWVALGKISHLAGFAGVHLFMLAAALLLFRHRMTLVSWRSRLGSLFSAERRS